MNIANIPSSSGLSNPIHICIGHDGYDTHDGSKTHYVIGQLEIMGKHL